MFAIISLISLILVDHIRQGGAFCCKFCNPVVYICAFVWKPKAGLLTYLMDETVDFVLTLKKVFIFVTKTGLMFMLYGWTRSEYYELLDKLGNIFITVIWQDIHIATIQGRAKQSC